MTLFKKSICFVWACFLLFGDKETVAEHQGQNAENDQVFPFALNNSTNYEDFIFLEGVFTPEECKKIINLGTSLGLTSGETGHELESNENIKIRKSKISWIHWNEETGWIFQRLYELTLKVNKEHYQFDLFGFYEKIQFTEYTSPDSHYTWHIDGGNKEFSTRKLSIVVQLSDPKDYEGGTFQVFTDDTYSIDKKQGAATFFPSYNSHRVTPITKGKRYTLVIWVNGPPFR